MPEIWKDIPWYERIYQASNLWNVRSLKNWVLKLEDIKWYKYIQLSKKWIRKKYLVHRLVGLAFMKLVDNKNEINHIDWDKSNNNKDNLEWSNRSDNTRHCVDILWKNCKRVWKYDLKWKLIEIYNSTIQASIKNWLNKSSVWKVCKWQRKTAWWFNYKFI